MTSKAIIQLGALFSFLAAQAGLAQVRSLGNLPDTFVFLLFQLTVPLGLVPSRSFGRLVLPTSSHEIEVELFGLLSLRKATLVTGLSFS